MSEAVVNGLAGAAGDIVAQLLTQPLTYPLQAVGELYSECPCFWKGMFPTLIMECNPSIQFTVFESLLRQLTEKNAANQRLAAFYNLGMRTKIVQEYHGCGSSFSDQGGVRKGCSNCCGERLKAAQVVPIKLVK